MTLAEELMNRMRQDELPPRERLEELLDFNPEKGTFHWKVDVGRRQAGDPAGAVYLTAIASPSTAGTIRQDVLLGSSSMERYPRRACMQRTET